MNQDPLASGIIIFLNEERFITETIESVVAQTDDRWELILVNNGSEDGSSTISQQYAQQFRVRLVKSEVIKCKFAA